MLKKTLLDKVDALRDLYDRLENKQFVIKTRNSLAKMKKADLENLYVSLEKMLQDAELLPAFDSSDIPSPRLSTVDEDEEYEEDDDSDDDSDNMSENEGVPEISGAAQVGGFINTLRSYKGYIAFGALTAFNLYGIMRAKK